VAETINENTSGRPVSPARCSVREASRQMNVRKLRKMGIDFFVGVSKERAEMRRPLAIPISSPTEEQRLVGKAISIKVVGRSRKRYGIMSDSETTVNENGRTFKVLDAKFIDNGNIKKMHLEYDVTELVQAGARPEEIPIVEFTADESGVLTYASRQYEANIEEYGNSTGYSLGRPRDGVVGKYMINSFMEGKEREEMENIFREAKGGFHVLKEINLPFFLMCLSCCMGLQCKGSNMTNVALSYVVKGGTFFYGAINNSRLSEKEWRQVWEAMAKEKRWWKMPRRREIRKADRRDMGKGGERLIALLSAAAWASSSPSNGKRQDKAKEDAMIAVPVSKAAAAAETQKYFSQKTFRGIMERLESKTNAGAKAKAPVAAAMSMLGISAFARMDIRSVKIAFMHAAAQPWPLHHAAMARTPWAAKAVFTSALPSASPAAQRRASPAFGRARSKAAKAAIGYAMMIAAAFTRHAKRKKARKNGDAGGIMLNILSYIASGVRTYMQLRQVSYYPYAEHL
jgi:hypothetical protein